MKNTKNILLIFGMFLFVGSMTSCKAIKRAKSKRCKCPSWSMEDQQPASTKKCEDTVVAFSE